MDIKIYSTATAGANHSATLVNGLYALVGFALRDVETIGKFYVPVLARLSEKGKTKAAVLSLHFAFKSDFVASPKLEYDAKAKLVGYRTNAGTVVNEIVNELTKKAGELVDVVWMRDIFSALRGKRFSIQTSLFTSLSRKGNSYVAHTYDSNFVEGADVLDFSDALKKHLTAEAEKLGLVNGTTFFIPESNDSFSSVDDDAAE